MSFGDHRFKIVKALTYLVSLATNENLQEETHERLAIANQYLLQNEEKI